MQFWPSFWCRRCECLWQCSVTGHDLCIELEPIAKWRCSLPKEQIVLIRSSLDKIKKRGEKNVTSTCTVWPSIHSAVETLRRNSHTESPYLMVSPVESGSDPNSQGLNSPNSPNDSERGGAKYNEPAVTRTEKEKPRVRLQAMDGGGCAATSWGLQRYRAVAKARLQFYVNPRHVPDLLAYAFLRAFASPFTHWKRSVV